MQKFVLIRMAGYNTNAWVLVIWTVYTKTGSKDKMAMSLLSLYNLSR